MLTDFKMEKITPSNYITYMFSNDPEIDKKNRDYLDKMNEEGFDVYYVSGRYKGRLASTLAAVNRKIWEETDATIENMENFYRNNLEKWCEEHYDEMEILH